MLQSMTGYGRSECSACQRKIVLELKSLNSKQLDLNLRFPNILRALEANARTLISNSLKRGKIDLFVFFDESSGDGSFNINPGVAVSYHKQINELAESLGIDKPGNPLEILMKLPEVIASEKEEISKDDKEMILKALHEAVDNVSSYRLDEGKAMHKDLKCRLEAIQKLKEDIPALTGARKEKIKLRLQNELSNSVTSNNIDMNRFEQEIIYYIEKLDINEELVRLDHHCAFFMEVLQENDSQGKKLGFISQEIGREINTIGAKANDAEIQKLVVLMKDELEKIKEQLHNIL